MTSINDKVVIAQIGAGGRGTQVILSMQKCNKNVEVKYICDVDQERGGRAIDQLEKQQGKKPAYVVDMRKVFDDKDVDAVVISTPEQWHALAAMRACEAGKDVYVEKNISLTIPEGRLMQAAAKKYNRIIQCGFQNRSADYSVSAREYIKSGKLGNIVLVKVFNMLPGNKPWFLKPDSEVPAGLDWDLWLGPAPKVPYNLSRHKGWYDWWDYSCGLAMADCSHQYDLARMVLGDPDHPKSVYCAGGRVLEGDHKDDPDNQTVIHDFGTFPMATECSVYGEYLSKSSPEIRYGKVWPNWQFNADRIEIYGTEGLMYLGRHGAGWQVFGADNKLIAEHKGYFPDEVHQQNYIECVRTRKEPNANIEQGHRAAVLVHLANMAYRVGKKQLFFDPVAEKVVNSEEAEKLCHYNYRSGFELPKV